MGTKISHHIFLVSSTVQSCQSGYGSHQNGFRLIDSLMGFFTGFFRVLVFFMSRYPGTTDFIREKINGSGSVCAEVRADYFQTFTSSPKIFCFILLWICTRTVPVFAKCSRPLMALKSTTPQVKSSKSSYLDVIQPDSCPHMSYTGMSKGPPETKRKEVRIKIGKR